MLNSVILSDFRGIILILGEHNLLYVSHPVDLTNTVHSLSELKYNRLLEVLEDEVEWTDDDDDDYR